MLSNDCETKPWFAFLEILKRHQGSFWIESEPGLGSTFYFSIPVSQETELKSVVKADVEPI